MRFRTDIEGLRAVAVGAIVLFHINPKIFPSGFIGVDVFFVISGYLITGSIRRQIATSQFKLIDFYARRVRRLFPALFVSLVGASALAYIVLLPTELVDFGQSALATVLYVANFYFYQNTGYFAPSADSVPLLHTWSLAVEEQFYLIFPIFLILTGKLSRRGFAIALFVVAALSLALSEALVHVNTPAAFFMAPSRFWQFLMGGAAALYAMERPEHKRADPILAMVGLIAFAGCLAVYRSSFPFPGIAAVPPTLATCLVIYGCRSGSGLMFRALSAPPLRLVGRWSYSIYLWHWPIIVFFRLGINHTPTPVEQTLLVLASVALGAMSYYLVERPAQRLNIGGPKVVLASAAFATACLGVMAAVPIFSGGMPTRLSPEIAKLAKFLDYDTSGFRPGVCFLWRGNSESDPFNEPECIKTKAGQKNLLLIGDSHAAHFRAQLPTYFPDYTISQVTASGCMPMSPTFGEERCTTLIKRALTTYVPDGNFDVIVISARWTAADAPGLTKLIEQIEPYSRVVVIGPNVEYSVPLPRLLIQEKLGMVSGVVDQASTYESVLTIDKTIGSAVAATSATYFSAIRTQCPNGTCITEMNDGTPLLFDRDHLTEDGAALLLSALQRTLVEHKRQAGSD